MVAVNDSFGESGTPTQLLAKYGLGPDNIMEAVAKVLKRKKA
jgi:transketolase